MAAGQYRVIDIAQAPAKLNTTRMTLRAVAGGPAHDYHLDVPNRALAQRGVAVGELVQVNERVYGYEFAYADTRRPFFLALQDDYQVLKANWGGYAGYDKFFAEPLSNAHLASIATYNDFVPAFRNLLRREKSWNGFYDAVNRLARLDKEDRHDALKRLGATTLPGTLVVQRSIGVAP